MSAYLSPWQQWELTGETEAFDEHIDTLFRAVHVAPLSTGVQVGWGWEICTELEGPPHHNTVTYCSLCVQALMLLYQVMESRCR